MAAEITVNGASLDQIEIQEYVNYLQEKHGRQLSSLTINVDGDFVDLNYRLSTVPFERIRRITGYLVGTMERWNDAKTAEEAGRVKHATESPVENAVGL